MTERTTRTARRVDVVTVKVNQARGYFPQQPGISACITPYPNHRKLEISISSTHAVVWIS
jgi:hypothetical protein